jgi:hypothetical protein
MVNSLLVLIVALLAGAAGNGGDIATVELRFGVEGPISAPQRAVLQSSTLRLLESSNFNSERHRDILKATPERVDAAYRKTLSGRYLIVAFDKPQRIDTVGGDIVVLKIVVGLNREDYADALYSIDAQGGVVTHGKYSGGLAIELLKEVRKVRPATAPKEIRAVNHYYFLSLSRGSPERLYVKGRYADDVEQDVSSSAAGTTYASSNVSVVSVDREGLCTVLAPGIAIITIANGGARDFVAFVIEDPARPSPPIDLAGQVSIRRGKLRLESNPLVVRSHYQQVTITNATKLPLVGPLFLAVTGLPKGVIAYGGDGEGRHALNLPHEGLGLLPGQSVTADLEFLNQGSAPLDYTARVYHGVAK